MHLLRRDFSNQSRARGVTEFFPARNASSGPDHEQAGSHRLIRWSSGNPLVLTEFASFKPGDVKGTIRRDMRLPFVSNDVRRHRLISISYISLLPCHGRGRGFESRRPRQFFQALARNWQFASWSNLVQLGQCFSLVEYHPNQFALCQPLVRHPRLSVKIQCNATVRMT